MTKAPLPSGAFAKNGHRRLLSPDNDNDYRQATALDTFFLFFPLPRPPRYGTHFRIHQIFIPDPHKTLLAWSPHPAHCPYGAPSGNSHSMAGISNFSSSFWNPLLPLPHLSVYFFHCLCPQEVIAEDQQVLSPFALPLSTASSLVGGKQFVSPQ